MNTLLRLGFLFVFTAALHAVAAPSSDTRSIEAEVARLDAARVEALLKSDWKALERLFSENLVYIHANGRVDSKQPYMASLVAGNLTYVSLSYDPPARVVVTGRDTAVVTGRATIEVKNKAGQLTKRVLTTTTVYVRSPAGWQVVSYQGTPVQS
jgi:ketosteroid isomerase-like protein